MHPNLLKLLVANKGKGFFKAEAQANDEATIYLYDYIVDSELEADWFGGISPLGFMKQLADIDASLIHLRINSPGGSVFAARTMQQAIREHKAAFVTHIDGIAASAATFFPMVTDESVIAPGGMLMIHNAWSIVLGNATDMRKTADLLEKIDQGIINDYTGKTGLEADQIKQWMAKETFFTADEAVANGFIDRVAATTTAKAQINWDLSAYHNAPKPILPKKSDVKDEKPPENPFKNRPPYRQLMTA